VGVTAGRSAAEEVWKAFTPTRGTALSFHDLAGGEPEAEALESEAPPEVRVGGVDHGFERRGFQTSFGGVTMA